MSSLILPIQNRSFHIPTPRILTSKDSQANVKTDDESSTLDIGNNRDQNEPRGISDTSPKFAVPKTRSNDMVPETASQMRLNYSDGHRKIRQNIILTPSPSSSQNNPAAKEAFAIPPPVFREKTEDQPKKPEIIREISSTYPDLEYDGKIYKFFDWEIVAKLVWVAHFTQPPTGLYYHSEDDYFLYFGKSKNRTDESSKPSESASKLQSPVLSFDRKPPQVKSEERAKEGFPAFSHERSSKDIEPEPPVLSEEKVSEILKSLQHSIVHRPLNDFSGSVVIKPSQGVFDSLKKQVEDRTRPQAEENSFGESLTHCRSKFTKNLPKKIGDQFADYLTEHYNVNMSKVFKDKMSWKVLNSYLEGQRFLEEKKLDTRTLIKAFINFIMTYNMKHIDESRTRDNVSKACYKLTILNLKVAFEKLSACVDVSKIKTLSIARSWPKLDIHYTLLESKAG